MHTENLSWYLEHQLKFFSNPSLSYLNIDWVLNFLLHEHKSTLLLVESSDDYAFIYG